MSKNDFKPITPEEIPMIESRLEDARKLLEAARIGLLRNRPFYGSMIANMPMIVEYRGLSTIATNGRDILYNPEFLVGMSPERIKLVEQRIDAMPNLSVAKKKKLKFKISVFYRPKTIREVIFLLEHEIRHVICEHLTRGRNYIHDLFNKAADQYINTNLVIEHSTSGMGRAWFNGVQTTFNDPSAEFAFMKYGYCDFKYLNWTTEKIYEDMFKDQPQGGSGQGDSDGGDGKDDSDKTSAGGHRGEKGQPTEDEADESGSGTSGDIDAALGVDPKECPEPTKEQDQQNQETMRRSILNATALAGNAAPKEAREFVATFEKAKIDYVKLIRKTMIAKIRTDVTYRKPHRSSFGITYGLRKTGHITKRQTVILPSATQGNTVDIWIGFDVSGSVHDALLQRIYKEIMGLTLQYKQFRIHLFCWSTHVGDLKEYDKKNIKDIVNYKIKTSYGTDANCVFEYLEDNKCKVDQLIVFTDGYFSNLKKQAEWGKKYDTLWVIFGNDNWKQPFGKMVNFDKYLG